MQRDVTFGESPTDSNSSSVEHQQNLKIKQKRIINSCHANIYKAGKFVKEYVKNDVTQYAICFEIILRNLKQ